MVCDMCGMGMDDWSAEQKIAEGKKELDWMNCKHNFSVVFAEKIIRRGKGALKVWEHCRICGVYNLIFEYL